MRKAALGGLALPFLAGMKATMTTPASATTRCDETPEGEEGPFPTKKPADFGVQNIVSGREGTPLAIQIEVLNVNNQCRPLPGAFVDIWHCDAAGGYSEYGGLGGFGPPPGGRVGPPMGGPNGRRPPGPPPGGPPPMMNMPDHRTEHFLRGRQTTNAGGQVSFSSIYPGWYPGRAPHIHAHIFDGTGKSLLVTQIAFPDDVSKRIYAQGPYAAHGQSGLSAEADHVFSGNLAQLMPTLTGSVVGGYALKHAIYVKA